MNTNFNITGDIDSPVDTLNIGGTEFTYSELPSDKKLIVDNMVLLLKNETDICCKLTINHTDVEIEVVFTDMMEMDEIYHSLKDIDDMTTEGIELLDSFISL